MDLGIAPIIKEAATIPRRSHHTQTRRAESNVLACDLGLLSSSENEARYARWDVL
jgi:hypothetical protein